MLAYVFYSEVIDSQDEHDGSCFVFPQAGSDFAWFIPMFCEYGNKEVICQKACLGEVIDSLSHLKIDISIVGQFGKVILVYYFLWDVCQFYSDIFVSFHRCV